MEQIYLFYAAISETSQLAGEEREGGPPKREYMARFNYAEERGKGRRWGYKHGAFYRATADDKFRV